MNQPRWELNIFILIVLLAALGASLAAERRIWLPAHQEPLFPPPVTFCAGIAHGLKGQFVDNDADCSFPNIRDI